MAPLGRRVVSGAAVLVTRLALLPRVHAVQARRRIALLPRVHAVQARRRIARGSARIVSVVDGVVQVEASSMRHECSVLDVLVPAVGVGVLRLVGIGTQALATGRFQLLLLIILPILGLILFRIGWGLFIVVTARGTVGVVLLSLSGRSTGSGRLGIDTLVLSLTLILVVNGFRAIVRASRGHVQHCLVTGLIRVVLWLWLCCWELLLVVCC